MFTETAGHEQQLTSSPPSWHLELGPAVLPGLEDNGFQPYLFLTPSFQDIYGQGDFSDSPEES